MSTETETTIIRLRKRKSKRC